MKIDNDGINLIKKFEGCRLTAYKDSAGIWTIGYGHTKGVKSGQRISQAKADEYLISDLASAEKAVNSYHYLLTQGQFNALVSFTFNCGAGNLKKLTNNGTRTLDQISARLTQYTKAGGKELAGLILRRALEKELFDSEIQAQEEISMREIKKGSKGQVVKLWQVILQIKIDGDFGPITDNATKLFQKNHSLNQTGVVDQATWNEGLKSVL